MYLQGRDHVFIAPWWGAKAAWGKALWAAGSVNSVLVTFDEGFAHDWGKVGKRGAWVGRRVDGYLLCVHLRHVFYLCACIFMIVINFMSV